MASRQAPVLLSVVGEGPARGLAREAGNLAGCRASYEAPDPAAALEVCAGVQPDVCLLAAELCGDLAGDVSSLAEVTRLVVIASAPAEAPVLTVLDAGASGYVAADVGADGLAAAIADVLAGRIAVPRRLVGDLVDEIVARPPAA